MIMKKENWEIFDKWNKVKKHIDKKDNWNLYVRNREIWYINIWKNIWYESNWKWDLFKRPVLILKIVWNMLFSVSLTTKWKDSKFYYKLNYKYFKKKSFITLSQAKIIDKKRLIEKIWQIDKEDFVEIKNRLKSILF